MAFDAFSRERFALRGLRADLEITAAGLRRSRAERRKQQVDHIRDYFAQRARLNNVAFRIRVANNLDCRNRSTQIGLDAGTVPSLPRKFRSYSQEALSVSWTQATVISVAETSPAAAAGIKPGDHLMTFNNEAVPRTDTSAWISHFVDNNGEQPIRVLVRRDGVDEIRTITTVKACAIPVELITDSSPNAFTTGDKIVIHSSILRIAHTDAQLALVLGHELAHANLGHLDKQWLNQVLGWAGGAAIDAGLVLGGISTGGVFARQFARAGERAFSVNFEREADTSVPTTQPGLAMNLPEQKSSGGRFHWKVPTQFELPKRIR